MVAIKAARSWNIAGRETLPDTIPLPLTTDIAGDRRSPALLAACGAGLHLAGQSEATRDRSKRACAFQ